MAPPLTTATPSSIFHFSAPFQALKFLPSNSMIASVGGLPGLPGELGEPRVTTGGSCHSVPVRYSWALQTPIDATIVAAPNTNSTARNGDQRVCLPRFA